MRSKFICLLFSVTVICGTVTFVRGAASRTVSHEEIKEALIDLMYIMRSNTEKLERHEIREKQLGELLKRALSALDKRGRAQDGVMEKILEAQQIMTERFEASLERLTAGFTEMFSTVQSLKTRHDEPEEGHGPSLSSVAGKLEANMFLMDSLNSKLEESKSRGNLDNDIKYELERNSALLKGIHDQLDTLTANSNKAGELGGGKHAVLDELSEATKKLETRLAEISSSVVERENTLVDAVKTSQGVIGNQLADLQSMFDGLNKEAKAIGNVEQVLVKTADDVMDTKRRVEHGIYQIRSEVNDYVKSYQGGNEYNDTMTTKFKGLTDTILEGQSTTVANLSTKVESEISQVWRQIGIMHQQITTSGITLDNLQNQTDTFIKDTENKMDAMSSKLEHIESSIDLVQENNNFLVGRFSLFTHEFNETRTSLAQTTKDLKRVLKQGSLNRLDVSPGPHDIDSSSHTNLDDNKL